MHSTNIVFECGVFLLLVLADEVIVAQDASRWGSLSRSVLPRLIILSARRNSHRPTRRIRIQRIESWNLSRLMRLKIHPNQPSLTLAIPPLRFASRVGGDSAHVRRHHISHENH